MPTAHEEVESLLARIRARAGDAETSRAADEISVLCRGYMADAPDARWTGLRLTRLEGRLMAFLAARLDKVAPRGAIMDALYFDRPHAEPDIKIVDILVCKIRRKLKGSEFVVETVWGEGYRARYAPDAALMLQAHAMKMMAG